MLDRTLSAPEVMPSAAPAAAAARTRERYSGTQQHTQRARHHTEPQTPSPYLCLTSSSIPLLFLSPWGVPAMSHQVSSAAPAAARAFKRITVGCSSTLSSLDTIQSLVAAAEAAAIGPEAPLLLSACAQSQSSGSDGSRVQRSTGLGISTANGSASGTAGGGPGMGSGKGGEGKGEPLLEVIEGLARLVGTLGEAEKAALAVQSLLGTQVSIASHLAATPPPMDPAARHRQAWELAMRLRLVSTALKHLKFEGLQEAATAGVPGSGVGGIPGVYQHPCRGVLESCLPLLSGILLTPYWRQLEAVAEASCHLHTALLQCLREKFLEYAGPILEIHVGLFQERGYPACISFLRALVEVQTSAPVDSRILVSSLQGIASTFQVLPVQHSQSQMVHSTVRVLSMNCIVKVLLVECLSSEGSSSCET